MGSSSSPLPVKEEEGASQFTGSSSLSQELLCRRRFSQEQKISFSQIFSWTHPTLDHGKSASVNMLFSYNTQSPPPLTPQTREVEEKGEASASSFVQQAAPPREDLPTQVLKSKPPEAPPEAYSVLIRKRAEETLESPKCYALAKFLLQYCFPRGSEEEEEVHFIFDYLKKNYFVPFSLRLTHAILDANPRSVDFKEINIFLLSSLLSKAKGQLWPKIAGDVRQELKGLFLECLKKERSRALLSELSEFVADIADQNAEEKWPEIVEFLCRCLDAGNDEITLECGFLLLSNLAPSSVAEEKLVNTVNCLHLKLTMFFRSNLGLEIKTLAAKAAIRFILKWTNPANRDRYDFLYSQIMDVLVFLIKCKEDKLAQVVIEELTLLASANPLFLRYQFGKTLLIMFLIARNAELQHKTRELALEFVLTTAEEKVEGQAMLIACSKFTKKLLEFIFSMLADVKHDPVSEISECNESNVRSMGKKFLERFATALGGNFFWKDFFQLVNSSLVAEDWQTHYAAASAISIVSLKCSEASKAYMSQMAEGVLLIAQIDDHPLVRWTAINTIRNLCTSLSPEFQDQYHPKLLPILMKAMDDFTSPHIQVLAATTMFNFTSKCTPNTMEPYLDVIMSEIIIYLEKGQEMLKRVALRLLAAVVASLKERTKEYYSKFMPYLRIILLGSSGRSNCTLLPITIECITLFWMTVGKEKMKGDIDLVVQTLLSPQVAQWASMKNYVLNAWGRLCKCLGQEFRPYLMVSMPSLLQSAQPQPAILPKGSRERGVLDISIGAETVRMKLSGLGEKYTACHVLHHCAIELKEELCLWIEMVAHTLIPVLTFIVEDIQEIAITAMPTLLKSCKAAAEKGYIKWCPYKHLCAEVNQALMEASNGDFSFEIYVSMLRSLKECMEISETTMDTKGGRQFLKAMIKILKCSPAILRSQEGDSNEAEGRYQYICKEGEIHETVGDCITIFIKSYKHTMSKFLDGILPFMELMWSEDRTARQRTISFRIFHEIMKECQAEASMLCNQCLPQLIEGCQYENPDVKEVVARAIGVCAELGGFTSSTQVAEAVAGLSDVIQHPKALQLEYIMAHDIAVSALGKIIQFQRTRINAAEVLQTWLKHMPIGYNLNVANVVHEQLCSLVENVDDEELFDKKNANISKIIAVYAEILCAGTKLATEQTTRKMVEQLRLQQRRLPAATWAAIILSLEVYQQSVIESKLS